MQFVVMFAEKKTSPRNTFVQSIAWAKPAPNWPHHASIGEAPPAPGDG